MSKLGGRSIESDVRRLRVLLTKNGHIYKTKVSADDTTPGFLSDKITSVDSSVAIAVANDGADEDLDLSVSVYVAAEIADHASDPDAHHNQSHVLATTSGLGPDHTVSGLTARQVLVASGATTALFRTLQSGDLPTGATLSVSSTNDGTSHAITTSNAVTTATAVILATDSNGRTQVRGLGVGATAGASNAVTLPDDGWIGLGAAAGRFVFYDETSDIIRVHHADIVMHSDSGEDKLFIRRSGDVELTEADIFAHARLGLAATTDVCFFIDSANDSTTDSFRWYINGESQAAAAEIARLTEAGEFTFKTPGLTTGMTSLYETDVHGALQVGGGSGALFMTGLGTSTAGAVIRGIATTANTTKTSSATAPIILRTNLKSGTTAGAMSANGNLVAIQDNTTTRWFVDVEGDTYRDGSDSAFDTYADAHLARAFDRAISPRSVIDSEFDAWVDYGRADLERAGILSPDSNFYNESRLLRLAIGAVWQEYTERQRLTLRVQELEQRLLN